MDEKKLEKLEKLIKLVDEDYVKSDEFIEAFSALVQIIKEVGDDKDTSIQTLKDQAESIREVVLSERKLSRRLQEQFNTRLSSFKNDLLTAIEDVKSSIPEVPAFPEVKDGYTPIKGKDYFTEEDKNEIALIALSQHPFTHPDHIKALIPDYREELQKQIKEIERIAKANQMPITTSFINGRRAKNIDFVGATVSYEGDKAIVTVTGGGTVGPGTTNEIAYFDSATTVASLSTTTYPSLTELSYVKGVTSAIQTQLDAKIDGSGAATRVAYWSDADTLASDTSFTFSGGTWPTLNFGAAGEVQMHFAPYTGALEKYKHINTNFVYDGVNFVYDDTSLFGLSLRTYVDTTAAASFYEFFTTNAANGQSLVSLMKIAGDGKVGIGTDSPATRLHLLATTEQLRLGYDASNYFSTTVASNGTTTFNLVGTAPTFTFSDAVGILGTNPDISLYALHVAGKANYGGSSAISGFFNYQSFGTWDAYGAVSPAGTTLAIGGYRASQWVGVKLYADGAERLGLSSSGAIFPTGNVTLSAVAANLNVGTSTSTSTATPTILNMGGTFADTVTSAKAKWKLYYDGTDLNTYGIGISSGQMNFFKSDGGSYNWYFGDVGYLFLSKTLNALYPVADNVLTLGGILNNYAGLYLGSTAPINWNNGVITMAQYSSSGANDALKVRNSGTGATLGLQNANASGFSGIEYIDNGGSVAVFTGYNNAGSEFRFNNIASGGYITFKISGNDRLMVLNNGLIGLHGSTSSFPALKRSSAIIQARLADDSAYTDIEVADEAYDATNWNGSLEVPTKNAIRDKIESIIAGGGGATTELDNLGTTAINAHLLFDTDATYDIGSSTVGVNDIHFGSGGVVNFDGGDVTLTHSANTLTMAGGVLVLPDTGLQVGASVPFSDTAGTLTLQNIDALDATTEATIEAAIDTLANLTSIQGRTVTLADAGADALLGWDDSASAYQNLSAADARTALGLATSDSPQFTALNVGHESDTTITRTGAGDIAVEGNAIYRAGGTDVPLADGGTGASLTDPNADRIMFWDDSAGAVTWLAPGNSLAITTTTIDTIQDIRTTANPQFATIELGAASDTTLSRSAAGVLAVEGVVIPSISSTNTLTNKRITKRTGTTASSATPTINTDNVDFYSITALAANITSFTTNLSGTPTDAQTLWIAITDDGTPRTIAWGASFEASTVALPTMTTTSTRLDVGFVWNTATSKWRCIAVA